LAFSQETERELMARLAKGAPDVPECFTPAVLEHARGKVGPGPVDVRDRDVERALVDSLARSPWSEVLVAISGRSGTLAEV